MAAIFTYLASNQIAFTLLGLSVTIIGGILIGKIKIFGISLEIAGVLFLGIVFGHYGLVINDTLLYFIRDFGLILFVYAIGMQVGPGFFNSLRKQGLKLNILATLIVLLGVGITALLVLIGGIKVSMAVGLLAGGTTNTPSLAAAQQLLRDLSNGNPDIPATGYALAYPFGVLGIIITIVLTRFAFRIRLTDEVAKFVADNSLGKKSDDSKEHHHHPQLVSLFIGIAFGVCLGIIPIPIPGFPVPLKLGLAGGPLVSAIILARIGRLGPLNWHIPTPANLMFREFGIALFLGCVGIKAGAHFVETLVMGQGLYLMICAALITVIPLVIVGLVARLVYKMNYITLCGLLTGSMTDPPALAFAHSMTKSDGPAMSYSTVYPLVMLLRIFSAQILIFLLYS